MTAVRQDTFLSLSLCSGIDDAFIRPSVEAKLDQMTAPGLALIWAGRLALLLLLPVIRAESISGLLGRTLSSTDKKYIDILKSIVPYDYAAFLNSNYQGSRLSQSKDIIMVEVDMQSSELLNNSIISLRLAKSPFASVCQLI